MKVPPAEHDSSRHPLSPQPLGVKIHPRLTSAEVGLLLLLAYWTRPKVPHAVAALRPYQVCGKHMGILCPSKHRLCRLVAGLQLRSFAPPPKQDQTSLYL